MFANLKIPFSFEKVVIGGQIIPVVLGVIWIFPLEYLGNKLLPAPIRPMLPGIIGSR